jgi:DNA-binding NarL/FixJ family response regulator
MRAPFVGRAGELEQIRALGQTIATDRRPSALLLVGEAGLGKSRLLDEARSAIAVRHFDVVGYEPERGVPLAAASELLRALMRSDPGGRLSELLNDPANETPLEPIRVFEAVRRTAELELPFLILVDDLQWVDGLSLALCHYLLRAAVSDRRAVGLLAVSRPSPVVGVFSEAVRRVFADSGPFAIGELKPLERNDGIRLARTLAPGLRANQAAALWARAAGSPFWLSVLAGSPADRPADHVIEARLRYAPPDAAELLALLAVAGRPATVEEMMRLEGWPEERLQAALDELVATGLATRAGIATSLVHDLIRDAVDVGLSDETRRRLHQAWAGILEDAAADDLGTLRSALEHRRAAGMNTVELALRLVRSPRRRWLGSDGLALIGMIADEAESTDAGASELRVATAALAAELGEDRIAYERWTVLAEQTPAGPEKQRALLGAARAAYELSQESLSRRAIDRARAGATASASLITLDALEAEVVMWLQGKPTDGWALARRAADEAQRIASAAGGVDRLPADDRRAVIDALRVVYQAAVQDDQWRVVGEITAAYFDAAHGFDGAAEIRALLARGTAALIQGEYRDALAIQRRAWEESHRHIYPTLAAEVGLPFAHMLIERGQIGAAQNVIQETVSLVDRIGTRGRLLSRSQYVAHEATFHAGDRRTAVAALEQAADTAEPHYAISAHRLLATWLGFLDGPAAVTEVVAHVEAGRTCAVTAGCPRCGLELELWAARALAWVGRPSQARDTMGRWDIARPDPNPDDAVTRLWVEGLLSAQDPGSAQATDGLSNAITEAERQGKAIDAISLRLDLGRVVSTGDRETAADYYAAAMAGAREAGSVALERLADRGLRDLGVRTWRRGPVERQSNELTRGSAALALSPRELEVARLVMEGASNPEIAAQLFLSRKTVERHISNALAKVGARNRTELAHELREIDSLS